MKRMVKWFVGVLTIISLAVVLGGCGSPTVSSPAGNNPSSAADFYKGKTLSILVPFSPGGGYDQWARLISPYMQKYLGVGKVEVINETGGGGMVGTNKIYAAQPDGLTIGDCEAAGGLFSQIFHTPGVNFDISKFNWIGRADDDPRVIAVHANGPYQSFADLIEAKNKGVTIKPLALGVGGSDYIAEVIAYNAFQIPFQMVAAFSGSSEEKGAFLTGNGDSIALTASDVLQVEDAAKIVALISTKPFAKLPNVPTIVDLAKQEKLPADRVNALDAMAGVMDLGKAFFAPPGVPADRLAALRNAFKQSLADPDFVAAAGKANLFVGYASPDDLEKMADTALSKADLFKPLLQTK